MKLDICTLFPDFFTGPLHSSILKRAREKNIVNYQLHDMRDYTEDKHNRVDDRPFGGGPGMVLKPQPVFDCIESLALPADTPVILTSPRAPLFTQQDAIDLSKAPRVVFLCGHYEGMDERIREQLATHVYSIGSYVLTGGEAASLVMLDAIVRLIPGVVGTHASIEEDSFMDGLLDCPHYTRPANFRDLEVPAVLQSGNHAHIERWRHVQKMRETQRWRPDIWDQYPISAEEKKWLNENP